MGYYTKFKMEVSEKKNEILEYLESDGNEYISEIIDDVSEECKWYDHERDVLRVSKEFPDVLFSLFGDGEEQGDSWKKYFKNGKMQKCYAIITYDEYDEIKLV